MSVIAPPKKHPPVTPRPDDALIEEARRRARRRRLGYAACAVAMAGAAAAAFVLVGRGGTRPQPSAEAAPWRAPIVPRVPHSNGLLAMVEQNELAVVRPDGRVVRKLAACPGGDACDFAWYAWSPNGKQLAFLAGDMITQDTPANAFLYVIKPDGSGRRRLARCGNCGIGSNLSWSPDGRWVAFASPAGVRIVDTRTGGRRTVIGIGGYPAWSPDGSKIAFASEHSLYTIRPDGSGLTRVASTDDLVGVANPTWSPDGTRLAFDTGEATYVVDVNGSNPHRIVSGSPELGPSNPSWSPNGRHIVYFATPGSGPGHFGSEVWIARPDGTGRRRLYHSGSVGIWSPPVWSPDGKLIAIAPHGERAVLFLSADGKIRRKVAGYARAIAWQPVPKP